MSSPLIFPPVVSAVILTGPNCFGLSKQRVESEADRTYDDQPERAAAAM